MRSTPITPVHSTFFHFKKLFFCKTCNIWCLFLIVGHDWLNVLIWLEVIYEDLKTVDNILLWGKFWFHMLFFAVWITLICRVFFYNLNRQFSMFHTIPYDLLLHDGGPLWLTGRSRIAMRIRTFPFFRVFDNYRLCFCTRHMFKPSNTPVVIGRFRRFLIFAFHLVDFWGIWLAIYGTCWLLTLSQRTPFDDIQFFSKTCNCF